MTRSERLQQASGESALPCAPSCPDPSARGGVVHVIDAPHRTNRLRAHLPLAVTLALGCLAASKPALGQELEPKAYSASPVGAAFLVVAMTRSTGSVVTDPTLPVRDVDATVYAPVAGMGYTFGLFGKLALASAMVPYSWGTVTGVVGENERSVDRSGLADMRAKLSVNFIGNPAMGARAFAKAPRKTIVGASLTFTAPTGQYDGDKLINLGTNRWSFKPEVGVAVPLGRWELDAYLGVWLFGDNTDFYPGDLTRSQDPTVSFQVHGSYTFRPRLWLAINATGYRGGGYTAPGQQPGPDARNSRIGATLALPMARQQSLKLAYSSGMVVRTGTDFRTVSVAWQWLWLTRP